MTPTSVYITFDYLDRFSGAGQVCINEIDALSQVTDVKQVITKEEVSQKIARFYSFNPFLFDYFASTMINYEGVDLAHLSCSPANAVLSKLKPKHYVVNCPAHNLEDSIKEYESITHTPYPFEHNVDPYLHDTLLSHLKNADAVITPSKGSKDWIEDNIKPKRVVIIPHGVILPEQVIYPEQFTNVGYIGAWGYDKGLKYLIEAWSKLNYSDSTLIFFGRGIEQMEPMLRNWATGGKYHLYGGFESLDEIMPLFSVYAHPSVSEGFGITVLEAMAYGKTVVVSTGTGSSMLIEDGMNGLTFKPRDVDTLASHIEGLKKNFNKSLGVEARKTAEHFSWANVKKSYIKLYEEIIS